MSLVRPSACQGRLRRRLGGHEGQGLAVRLQTRLRSTACAACSLPTGVLWTLRKSLLRGKVMGWGDAQRQGQKDEGSVAAGLSTEAGSWEGMSSAQGPAGPPKRRDWPPRSQRWVQESRERPLCSALSPRGAECGLTCPLPYLSPSSPKVTLQGQSGGAS